MDTISNVDEKSQLPGYVVEEKHLRVSPVYVRKKAPTLNNLLTMINMKYWLSNKYLNIFHL